MACEDFGFNAHDVSESLARLSEIANVKGCEITLSHAQLEEQWHEIAVAAANSAVDALALERLKHVLGFIETVIISCGAPDNFDVYEGSFETLAKISCVLPGLETRNQLILLLENVNEVYDVLLSCVETYEWVQPGATGLLRLWMFQALFSCFGAHAITGRDLMELTDNDVSGAISLISFILRCEHAPYVVQSTAGRCLVELTAADSIFLAKGEAGEDLQNQQITKLTGMLNRHVNSLIKGLIQFEVVESFGRCICQHQMSHTHTDVIVNQFLTTIHNSLLYCSENQKKLRQHLATQSTIVQDIMIPYVHNIIPALYDNPACCPSNIEFLNLRSVLQTFVVVTFNINAFRTQLRDNDLLVRLCEVPNILKYVSMLELLIKLSINVDFTKGPYVDVIFATMQAAFASLPPENQRRLQRRMTSEQGMRLPFARSSVRACELFGFVLEAPPGEQDDPQSVEEKKAYKRTKWRQSKNKARKRKRMFGMQAKQKGFSCGTEPDDEDSEEDDDMPPLIAAENWEPYLGQSDESFVPNRAKCQLSGAMMHDPIQTPDGFLFERAALEDWTESHGNNPLTGQPLNINDCAPACEIASFIQGYQLQMLSTDAIVGAAFDEPSQPDIAPPLGAVANSGASLLGDLPALPATSSATSPKSEKKAKRKISIPSRSVVDCPDSMRCAIDGKVMINPVRSPYGHFYERKTLERWFQNCGSICPMTQNTLKLDECVADAELKKAIVKFIKGQA